MFHARGKIFKMFVSPSTFQSPLSFGTSRGPSLGWNGHFTRTNMHDFSPRMSDSIKEKITTKNFSVDWWNYSGINHTTPAGLTGGTSERGPDFPAGYPSGFTWTHIICSSIVVTLVILIIVIGNFLVMWAIVTDRNLKSTQNLFIWSLALADFLLGFMVVPFSLANELMGYWLFGTIFCELWKATDVLLCTASITSLCLISLDRYWSITKAIHYSRQRTPKRAAIMIFIVWFVSAAICIPPLIGWKQPAPDSDWPRCGLSEDIGYVLYSSMGSFYIPAFIMVFVYFKIYQAAKARARKSVSKVPRGAISEKSEQKNSTESSGTEHCSHQPPYREPQTSESHEPPLQTEAETEKQGNQPNSKQRQPQCIETPAASRKACVGSAFGETRDVTTNPLTSEDESFRLYRGNNNRPRSRSLSLPCSGYKNEELAKLLSTDSDSCDALGGRALNLMDRGHFVFHSLPTTTTDTDSSADVSRWQDCIVGKETRVTQHCERSENRDVTTDTTTESAMPSPKHGNGITVQKFKIVEPKQNGSAEQNVTGRRALEDTDNVFGSFRQHFFNRGDNNPDRKLQHHQQKKKKGRHPKKNGKEDTGSKAVDFFSADRQKRKLAKARERRATVVLGLVMAAFIFCWLPFFILYVTSAFCVNCIPPMVFTVFFWIGYGNSALNPIIYTVFNRDFRRAFHRIIFGRKRGRR